MHIFNADALLVSNQPLLGRMCPRKVNFPMGSWGAKTLKYTTLLSCLADPSKQGDFGGFVPHIYSCFDILMLAHFICICGVRMATYIPKELVSTHTHFLT